MGKLKYVLKWRLCLCGNKHKNIIPKSVSQSVGRSVGRSVGHSVSQSVSQLGNVKYIKLRAMRLLGLNVRPCLRKVNLVNDF
jgi:hypothetical protein